MKISKPILIVFSVFFVLFSAFTFYLLRPKQAYKTVDLYGMPVCNFNYEYVDEIKISGLTDYRFRKTDSTWNMISPLKTFADESKIRALLASALNMRIFDAYKVAPKDLKDFGLTKDAIRVFLYFKDGRVDTLTLGNLAEDKDRMYVSSSNTEVYTVSARYRNDFMVNSLFEWRDKSLISIKQYEVNEFKLKNNNGLFHLTLHNGTWKIKSPSGALAKADANSVISFINGIATQEVKEVVNESFSNLKKYSLHKPAFEVELWIGEERGYRKLAFSPLVNNTVYEYNNSRPYIASLHPEFIKVLEKTLLSFTSKSITSFTIKNVSNISIKRNDSVWTIRNQGPGKWVNDKQQAVNTLAVNAFLNTLNALNAERVIGNKPDDVNLPGRGGFEIKIHDKSNRNLCHLIFGKKMDPYRALYNKSNGSSVEILDTHYHDVNRKISNITYVR